MKNYIFSFLVILFFPLHSQNLVPNPGFEDITECPRAYPGNTEIHFAEPWGELELYGNIYTAPHTGLSRAQIVVFSPNSYNKREYIQVPLVESLFVGQEYKVIMHIKNNNLFSVAI